MKKKLTLVVLLFMFFSLLIQTISLAESMKYSDFVTYLIESWSPNMTLDELEAKYGYGTPYSDSNGYVSYWDQDESTMHTYIFSDGRNTSVIVSYGDYPREIQDYVYTMYVSTTEKMRETLGDEIVNTFVYNDTGTSAEDISCAVKMWNGDNIVVLSVLYTTDTKVSIRTYITPIHWF